jgi:hypothetical protein
MRALRQLLIALSMLAGSMFLYAGSGFNIPVVEYGDVTSYGVPVGLALLLASVLMARYWDDVSHET